MSDPAEEQLREDIVQIMHDLDVFADEAWDLDAGDRTLRAAELYARLDWLQSRAIDQAVAEVSVPDFPPADNEP